MSVCLRAILKLTHKKNQQIRSADGRVWRLKVGGKCGESLGWQGGVGLASDGLLPQLSLQRHAEPTQLGKVKFHVSPRGDYWVTIGPVIVISKHGIISNLKKKKRVNYYNGHSQTKKMTPEFTKYKNGDWNHFQNLTTRQHWQGQKGEKKSINAGHQYICQYKISYL